MSTFTENYNLIKPDESDYYDVADFNENMDTIDAMMAETEAVMEEINEKIGTPANPEQTIFSMLSNTNTEIIRTVKTIQHVTYNPAQDDSSISIDTVDPSRCIVLLERLRDASSNGNASIGYTLNSNSLEVTQYDAVYTSILLFGFWIIEFY